MNATMKCPKGVRGVSFNGDSYEADEHGMVEVPVEACSVLASHGLVVVANDVGKDKDKDKGKK